MEQSTKQTLNKNLANLEETARKNGWVFKYDDMVDELYWSKPTISRNAKLVRLTDDFAFYIKPNGEVEGIFLEYAKFNFFEHEKSLKQMLVKLESSKQINTEALGQGLVRKFTDKVKSETIEAASFGNALEVFKQKTV